ncbi:hypothetical protein BRADI_4g04725v3 [Brachypodium distachyon]|uniref:Uncharacterized protein n=1 Tax=Brachypodium distachyon TaxID=15368 RepID=A0A2K2CKG9_BRADI|nr:hypothetical protein BRADI_4g04725v3 [Brachypodium distachyon]
MKPPPRSLPPSALARRRSAQPNVLMLDESPRWWMKPPPPPRSLSPSALARRRSAQPNFLTLDDVCRRRDDPREIGQQLLPALSAACGRPLLAPTDEVGRRHLQQLRYTLLSKRRFAVRNKYDSFLRDE